jgi:integrase/recombinase XerC
MLNELLNDFKEKMIANDISNNSVSSYVYDVKVFYKWYSEIDSTSTLEEITQYHLSAYRDYLVHNQRRKTSSINRNIQSLKNFFQFLVSNKLLKDNPSEKIKFLKQPKRNQPQALNKKDIHKLLSVTSHSSHGTQKRNYAIVHMLLQTGIRVGELVNLETRDLTLYERSGEIRVVDAKGGKERVIPLNNQIRRALRNYLSDQNSSNRKIIFLSKRNSKMSTRAVQKMITNLAKKAKIETLTPHTLRHTFAINYLRANPECLVELSALLGHDSLDTTAIYTAPSKERLAETTESTGDYINE